MNTDMTPGTHRILIADQRLDFQPAAVADPVPTGREIIAAASHRDPEQFIVLQQLPAGDLEELRLNEHTDLRTRGVEKFIVVRGDRSFRLVMESERQEWPVALINAPTLKRLGGKEFDEVAVFLERTDKADLELEDDEFVDLAQPGVERFYFRPREQVLLIEVNDKPVRILRGVHSGLQIKGAAIAQGVRISLDFVLSLHEAGGATRIIGNDDVVRVRHGQRYTAVADDDVS